jgi:predicted Holliday junction resolvase-like endonuclease
MGKMKRFIARLIGIIFVFIALISNADSHDMTIQDELLERQEDAARELQENQRSRADELREIQEERDSELQEYQEEAINELNQVDVRKHRKRVRGQENVFDHRPVFKDDPHNKNYNRTRKKDF